MAMNDDDMAELDHLLARARRSPAELPVGLRTRILADADAVQAGFAAESGAATVPTPGIWAQFLGVLGGWPALGGLAVACATGVWIGLMPPSFLPDPAQLVVGQGEYLDLIDMDDLASVMSEEG